MIMLLLVGIVTLIVGIVMNSDVLLVISVILILLRNIKKVSDVK